MNKKQTKNYLSVKNVVFGIILLTVLTVFSGWIDQKFSLNYWANWKIPLLLGLIGIMISLVIVPIALGAISDNDHLSKSSLRNGLITLNLLLIINIIVAVFKHTPIVSGINFFLAILDVVFVVLFIFKK